MADAHPARTSEESAVQRPVKSSKGQRRREQILHLLTTDPETNVTVSDLSETFGVSVATIRRDLSDLQEQRLITRTYGGAALQRLPAELTMVERESTHADAKRAIGRAGAALIEDGDLVILDSGSTTEQLAIALGDRPVTVVSNGLRVVRQLVPYAQVRVTVLGGSLRGFNETTYGPDAEAMLQHVYATLAFVGTDAVDPQRGITSRTYEQARLKSLMLQNSQQVFVVADSSKLGQHQAFNYWSPLPAGWGLITDDGADPEALEELRAVGATEIIIAPTARETSEGAALA
ncbi:DeoR/GlpR family DNA-binding transcription regulator [Raineyella fluvialis]|uniref:DeoR family transcriptional regulator n=1 Tax=Raineyella fluvialis TaxID=2662261 RepID=A0A5Q2F9A2_9ACTN|nr:DeoR/GlpR family DNA-binding transcription regulator [Raineyella fluvialis]QGF23268.1 DeoR family transcriptional regulator [Raineyella fluvialis]